MVNPLTTWSPWAGLTKRSLLNRSLIAFLWREIPLLCVLLIDLLAYYVLATFLFIHLFLRLGVFFTSMLLLLPLGFVNFPISYHYGLRKFRTRYSAWGFLEMRYPHESTCWAVTLLLINIQVSNKWKKWNRCIASKTQNKKKRKNWNMGVTSFCCENLRFLKTAVTLWVQV